MQIARRPAALAAAMTMRRISLLIVMTFWMCNRAVQADTTSPVAIVAQESSVKGNNLETLKINCPAGYVPTGHALVPKHVNQVVEVSYAYIDSSGNAYDIESPGASLPIGGGFAEVALGQNSKIAEPYTAYAVCFRLPAITDNVTVVKQTAQVQPGEKVDVIAFCPAGSTVALGNLSNGSAAWAADYGSRGIWGTSAAPLSAVDLPDGINAAPSGWGFKVRNVDTIAHTAVNEVICGLIKNGYSMVQKFEFTDAGVASVHVPMPDNTYLYGIGLDGGAHGFPTSELHVDSLVPYDAVNAFPLLFRTTSEDYVQTSDAGRGPLTFSPAQGVRWSMREPVSSDRLPKRVAVHAVVAPSGNVTPLPSIVSWVEYLQAPFNYFYTADLKEISDLNSGVHSGWKATGLSINVYASGSGGPTGRQPVCRLYEAPSTGVSVDNHFLSGDMYECHFTASKFAGSWIFEAGNVAQIDLPDPATGACPAGDTPIFRVVREAFHRLISDRGMRDQMVAQGWMPEGYGPDGVAMCSPR